MDPQSFLKEYITTYLDFPEEGTIFRDIVPLLRNPTAFSHAIICIKNNIRLFSDSPDVIVAPEATGFLFGAPVAFQLKLPFVPVRKPSKLPGEVIEQSYALEHGEAVLNIPANSIKPDDKVVIINDLLATGNTFQAIANLVEKMGGKVIHIACLIELVDLHGRDFLQKYDVSSVLTF